MLHLDGDRTPEMRQGRERLSISRPCVELALGSLAIDGYALAEPRQFGNRLAADAARFMSRGPSGERGRISKLDAHQMWRDAFGNRPTNSLANYRPGGAR